MGVEPDIEEIKEMSIEFHPKSIDDCLMFYRTTLLDFIGFELYRTSKLTIAVLKVMDRLGKEIFTIDEAEKTVREHDEIANKVAEDIKERVGKKATFDIGLAIQVIHVLHNALDETIRALGQGNIFNLILVPYTIYIEYTKLNITRLVAGLPKRYIREFKKGQEYFDKEIYDKYFAKMKKETTFQRLTFIANLMALLHVLGEATSSKLASSLKEQVMQYGGVPAGEKPTD